MDVDCLELVLQGIAFGTHGLMAPVCHILTFINGSEGAVQLAVIGLQNSGITGLFVPEPVKDIGTEEDVALQNIELVKIRDRLHAQKKGCGGIGLVIDIVGHIGKAHAAEALSHGIFDLVCQIADHQDHLADALSVQNGQSVLEDGGPVDFRQALMGAQGPGLEPCALARYQNDCFFHIVFPLMHSACILHCFQASSP